MGVKLYVGNLPFSFAEQDLFEMFSQSGNVSTARIVIDRETGRSKGFAFVEMGTDEAAANAIHSLNGKSFGGRAVVVNEARPREDQERPSNGAHRAPPRRDFKTGENASGAFRPARY
jgi:cold-inducible RNA-binding protein